MAEEAVVEEVVEAVAVAMIILDVRYRRRRDLPVVGEDKNDLS